MIVDTYRFGPLEVPSDKLITMERPVLGFEELKEFCIIEIEELSRFLWLQSTEDRNVAFLIANPVIFLAEYKIEVNPKEIAELLVQDVEAVETYVIVTLDSVEGTVLANLQGPILINTESRLAKQLVLTNSDYKVDHVVAENVASPAIMEEELEPAL